MDLQLVSEALHGAVDVDPTATGVAPMRLRAADLQRMRDPALIRVAKATSGVRLAFITGASWVQLDLDIVQVIPERMRHTSLEVMLAATIEGDVVEVVTPARWSKLVFTSEGVEHLEKVDTVTLCFTLPAAALPRQIELWLPVGAWTTIRAISSDAPLAPAGPTGLPRWVHYGSSISQGADVRNPLATWPVVAARRLSLNVTNLGLGGQAHVDPFAARLIRDLPADVISAKLGINVVNGDSMRERAFRAAVDGFIETIRDRHPTTPLVLISPLSCSMHESEPGPTVVGPDGTLSASPRAVRAGRGALALTGIREVIRTAVTDRPGDRHLFFVDGRDLLGPSDENHLHDGLHPNEAGHTLIGDRFSQAFKDLRLLE